MKRAVVTGGAGFIGSHVAGALLSRGVEVLIIDDFSSGNQENILAIEEQTKRQAHLAPCELTSEEALHAVVEFRPEVVFHLAAQANVRRSVKDPVFDAHTNVLGTVNLLEAARIADVGTFVFSSTGGAVYGEQDYFPADEMHKTTGECPYGVSKRCGELYLEYYARTYGMRCVALRYANVFGPRQNPKGEAGVIAIFIDRLKADEPLTVNGDGGQTRDFVYVGDVVNANMLAAANANVPFNIYNVGSEREISINEVAEALIKCWKELVPTAREHIQVLHGPVLPGEQRRSVIATGKIRQELHWKAEVDFENGLRTTVRSCLEGK